MCKFCSDSCPSFLLKGLSLNLKILFLSTTSARSQSGSVEIYFYFRLPNLFLNAGRSPSFWVLGYNPTTHSTSVNKIIPLGNFCREQRLFKKSFVFLLYNFTACDKGSR